MDLACRQFQLNRRQKGREREKSGHSPMSWIAEQGFSVKIKPKLYHINNISVSLCKKGINCDAPMTD